MTIPALAYGVSSQNQRVNGYEVPSEEYPRSYSSEDLRTGSEMDELIWAAYRQIFNEQQMLDYNRQRFLESQLRAGQITVREFIAGLVTSDVFRRNLYDVNNNYRFVELCIQRLLGRQVYGDREVFSWSIVLATKGLNGFINDVLSSEEYLNTFGDTVVPFQRRRILPQQSLGEPTISHTARYGASHLTKLKQMGLFSYMPPVAFNAPRVYQTALALLMASSVILFIVTASAILFLPH
ncbi:MAG: phycobilisome rod-core linker polypeptide [Cyanobacteria bacterium P01_E01_bin.6]